MTHAPTQSQAREPLAALKNVQRHMNVLLKENVEAMTATVCDHVVAAHSICGEAIAASILTPADDVAKLREAAGSLKVANIAEVCSEGVWSLNFVFGKGRDARDVMRRASDRIRAALADGEKSNG